MSSTDNDENDDMAFDGSTTPTNEIVEDGFHFFNVHQEFPISIYQNQAISSYSIASSGFDEAANDAIAQLKNQIAEIQNNADDFKKEFEILKSKYESQSQIHRSSIENLNLKLDSFNKMKDDFEETLEKERAEAKQRENKLNMQISSRLNEIENQYFHLKSYFMENFYKEIIGQLLSLKPKNGCEDLLEYFDMSLFTIPPPPESFFITSESRASQSDSLQQFQQPPFYLLESSPQESLPHLFNQICGRKRLHPLRNIDREEAELQTNAKEIIPASKKFCFALFCKWNECNQNFFNRKNLEEHLMEVHANTPLSYCCLWKDCTRNSRSFKSLYMMKKHLLNHINQEQKIIVLPLNPIIDNDNLEKFLGICESLDESKEAIYLFETFNWNGKDDTVKLDIFDSGFNDHEYTVDGISNLEKIKKICILRSLKLFNPNSIQTSILRNIIWCDASYFNLFNINLLKSEFDILTEGVIISWKSIKCQILDEDQNILPLNYIFSKIFTAQRIVVHPCHITPTFMAEIDALQWETNKLEELSMGDIDNEIHPKSFFEFIKKVGEPHVKLNLNFVDNQFGRNFEEALDDLIIEMDEQIRPDLENEMDFEMDESYVKKY